jgi:hypothetical protein
MQEGSAEVTRLSGGDSAMVSAGRFAVVGEDYALKAYPAAAPYVDGPVIFEDHFDKGLGNWQLIEFATGKPVPDPDGRRLQLQELEGDGRKVRTAVLSAQGFGGGLEMALRNRIPSGGMVAVEWRQCITNEAQGAWAAGWSLDGVRLSRSLVGGGGDNNPPAGVWAQCRLEWIPAKDPSGRLSSIEVHGYRDGQLVWKSDNCSAGEDWAFRLHVRNANAMVADVVVRGMKRANEISPDGHAQPAERVRQTP